MFRGSAAVAPGCSPAPAARPRAGLRLRHDVYADSGSPATTRSPAGRRWPGCPMGRGPRRPVGGVPARRRARGRPRRSGARDPVAAARVGTQQGLRLHRVRLDAVDIVRSAATRSADHAGPHGLGRGSVAAAAGRGRGGRRAAFRGLVTPDSLSAVAARLADRPGGGWRRGRSLGRRGRAAPAESLLRVRLFLAGLPRAQARPARSAAGRSHPASRGRSSGWPSNTRGRSTGSGATCWRPTVGGWCSPAGGRPRWRGRCATRSSRGAGSQGGYHGRQLIK